MDAEVTAVTYRPPDDAYRHEVEIVEAAELRTRVASNPDRGFERVDFQCFLFVRSGSYTHTVDFEPHRCRSGSCLLIGPGQVHRFGPSSDWDGWLLVAGSHHVPSVVEGLPAHVRTTGEHSVAIAELFARMIADAGMSADRGRIGDLLAAEVRVLVGRLALAGSDSGRADADLIDPALLHRAREYRAAVDRGFRRWHQVAPYARHLGCSTKSLNRACRAASDVTAKRVIVERIILEAKRILVHSSEPVAGISADLGFDEPTNFGKFFRRETGQPPAAFRASYRAR